MSLQHFVVTRQFGKRVVFSIVPLPPSWRMGPPQRKGTKKAGEALSSLTCPRRRGSLVRPPLTAPMPSQSTRTSGSRRSSGGVAGTPSGLRMSLPSRRPTIRKRCVVAISSKEQVPGHIVLPATNGGSSSCCRLKRTQALAQFDAHWKAEVAKKGPEKASFVRCLLRTYRWPFARAIVFVTLSTCFAAVGPVYFLREVSASLTSATRLGHPTGNGSPASPGVPPPRFRPLTRGSGRWRHPLQLIAYSGSSSSDLGYGIGMAVGLLVCDLARSALVHAWWFSIAQVSLNYRSIVYALV